MWQPQTRPFGFWILDFGSWILDFGFRQRFGFCIRLLLLHADSGRRIILIRSLCLLCTAFVHLRSCNSARAEIKAMSGGLGKRISWLAKKTQRSDCRISPGASQNWNQAAHLFAVFFCSIFTVLQAIPLIKRRRCIAARCPKTSKIPNEIFEAKNSDAPSFGGGWTKKVRWSWSMLGDLILTRSWIFQRSPPLQTLGSDKQWYWQCVVD